MVIIAMGVKLSELIEAQEIDWKRLRGKKIAIDSMNTLYQFLSTIRQQDGTPLMPGTKVVVTIPTR